MKGYVNNITIEKDRHGLGMSSMVVDFRTFEGAYPYATKQKAEDDAGMLEHHDIAITTAEGQRHVCKGYRVEELASGKFVIWVEAPFTSQTTGTEKPAPVA
jgi:hypothetical protein